MLSILAAIQAIFALPIVESNPSTRIIKSFGLTNLENWCAEDEQKFILFTSDSQSEKNYICSESEDLLAKFRMEDKFRIFKLISSDQRLLDKFKKVFSKEKDSIRSLLLQMKNSVNDDLAVDFASFFKLYFGLLNFKIAEKVQYDLDGYEMNLIKELLNAEISSAESAFEKWNQGYRFKRLSDIADFIDQKLKKIISNLTNGRY